MLTQPKHYPTFALFYRLISNTHHTPEELEFVRAILHTPHSGDKATSFSPRKVSDT